MSYRAGFVGLIGLPNSGKSTLMNALVGEKVSIVTAKPQTTRRRVMGVISETDHQVVFVDAPGIVQARSGLNLFLREEARDVIAHSDVLVALLNIDEKEIDHLDEVVKMVRESGKPWIALIHKTDLPQLHRPQILRERMTALGAVVVQGSSKAEPAALREILMEKIVPMLPEAPAPLYDIELYTLSATRELCAEIIREKCFEQLHQEVPFGLAVRILFFDETTPILRIHAEVIVTKENHRPIVIGQGGQVLKRIGTEARKEMEKLTGQKIFLDLKVVSKPNWQKNPGLMKDLGYVVPKA